MAGKKRLKPLVLRIPRPGAPASLEKKLLRALSERDLPKARTIIAQMPPDSKAASKGDRPKQASYQLLFVHALLAGNLNVALEVAVFANATVTERNLIDCMNNALGNNDLKTVLDCKERLGGKLSIRNHIYPVFGNVPDPKELSKGCPLLYLLIKFCYSTTDRNEWHDLIHNRLAIIHLDPSMGTSLERKLIALYDWPILQDKP